MLFRKKHSRSFSAEKLSSLILENYRGIQFVIDCSSHSIPDDEIFYYLASICDYSAYLLDKDRIAVSDCVLSVMTAELGKVDMDKYNSRSVFYGEFIRGKFIRASYAPGSCESINNSKSSIVRSCAAFCDLVYNPYCITDYDRAPVLITGILELIGRNGFYNTIYSPVLNRSLDIFEKFNSM